jgi:hypothetical protein
VLDRIHPLAVAAVRGVERCATRRTRAATSTSCPEADAAGRAAAGGALDRDVARP